MTYTPQTWNDNDPAKPLSAARMSHIESGISASALARTVMPLAYIGTPAITAFLTILNTDTTSRVSRASVGTTGSDGWISTTVTGAALVGGDFIARWDEGTPSIYNQELVLVP